MVDQSHITNWVFSLYIDVFLLNLLSFISTSSTHRHSFCHFVAVLVRYLCTNLQPTDVFTLFILYYQADCGVSRALKANFSAHLSFSNSRR